LFTFGLASFVRSAASNHLEEVRSSKDKLPQKRKFCYRKSKALVQEDSKCRDHSVIDTHLFEKLTRARQVLQRCLKSPALVLRSFPLRSLQQPLELGLGFQVACAARVCVERQPVAQV
jgi:hypothetical protein